MKGYVSLKRVLERYHAAVHDAFAAYGSFVAAHPLPPFLIGIILLGSVCIGLLRAKQESNIENLWVDQNSRMVSEKQAYNTYFGGISRKQSVAITMKDFPYKTLNDLGQAMDALTLSIKPLYDELNLKFSEPDQDQVELIQNDFCERPLIPKTLRPGADPNIHGNWYVWGYRFISRCSLDTAGLFLSTNLSKYYLPDDWGFDVLPCYKLSPMDCFQEGKVFDYPQALQQLEQLVIINATLNATLNQVVLEVEKLTGNLCFNQLQNKLNTNPKSIGVTANLSSEDITRILTGIKTVVTVFASWGYSWRPSYKNMSNEEILSYFNKAIDFSKNTTITDPAIEYCIAEHRPCCLTWFGAALPVEASFGSVKYDQSGKISSIGSLRWGANNWNQNHPLWVEYIATRLNTSFNDEQRKNLVLSWEDLMVKYLSPLHANTDGTNFSPGATFEDYQVQFTIWRSIEDVLEDANHVPIWQIILSAVLVFLYSLACFINFRHPVHSHGWLVLMGIIIVSFAIIAGFGLTSAFGIKLSPLAGSVVPFLALGLGIDDVFVLVNMLRIYMEKNISVVGASSVVIPKEEMKLIVSHAGPSVVLTTLSVLASFFISSVTPIPVVRWFCWQMGTTAVLHTFGMLLIFIPIMSLDARRIKAGIVDPLLWIFCGKRRAAAVVSNSVPSDTYNGYTARTPISVAVVKYYTPLFKYNSFKIITTVVFAILLGTCTYFGFWKVQIGLNLSDITLKGSYQHDYAKLTEISYPQYDIYLVTENIKDYSAVQTKLLEVYDRPENNVSTLLGSSAKILDYTWLENLIASVNLSLNIPYPFSPQNFTKLAQSWSTSPLGIFSLQDLYCENSSTGQQASCFAEKESADWTIRATKTVVFANNLGSGTKNIEMIKQTRKSLDSLNSVYFNGTKVLYMYGYPFLFNEQYLHSHHDLYMVVGFAIVGVFFAVLIFQFSLTISLIIAILLLAVDIEVYGFVYVLGAELNALSLVNLGIVIGMASEFTYLARSFLLFEGTRTERVQKALEWTFEPLLHGLGTQVVATLPLLLLKFHAFRVYYFGMFTIMGVLGFLNGFVMLPILLSWIGPSTLSHMTNRTALQKFDRNEEQAQSSCL